ncbi:MAG: T9SS type A sorting domain-containing protein [Flavobacteriales bacterium]|nr:T9SS type A sorting domain-containing protein [Flavobacteriales bacterium]
MITTRPLFSGALLALTTAAMAQCGPYRHHPVWPSTLGFASVNLVDCGATGALWDNGDTTEVADSLTVGAHSVTLFNGLVPLQTIPFNIEQQVWALNQQVSPMLGALAVSMWAEIDRCTPQIFDGLACPVDPAQTVAYLLQDGIAIDSLTPVDCILTQHQWTGLPFGHTYALQVIDHGPCGSTGQSSPVTAYDCSGLSLSVITQEDDGSGSGVVEVLGIDPGPFNPMAPPQPITGDWLLLDTNMAPIGVPQTGATALWSGLTVGTYTVLFVCTDLCSPVEQTALVDLSTNVPDTTTQQAPNLWPVPVNVTLHWSGGLRRQVQVLDALGRVVLRVRGVDQLDASTLPPGSYLLRFDNEAPVRFVKW